jgi:Fe/S biogenesis protein NfuA
MSTPQIELTEMAREKFLEFLAAEHEETGKENLAVRLAINGNGPKGFQYQLDIVDPAEEGEGTLAVDGGGFEILVEEASAPRLDGVSIDFVKRGLRSGFHFENPNSRWDDPVAKQVQELLDTEINPSVASHGGWVELLDVKEETAFIRFGGGCQGCGMADVTLKQGVEVAILERVPEVRRVLDTTDHAAGENPYFQGDGSSPLG